MGTDYYVYTEAKIGDKWVGIDPLLPRYEKDGTRELKYQATYWNGSRSYFSDTYDKFEQIGCRGKFSECSEEVKEQFPRSLENETKEESPFGGGYYPILIDYRRFKDYVDFNKYDSHGLIHKDRLFAYEQGEEDELWAAEHDELADLTETELQAYVYHEWDNDWGWHKYFKDILRKVVIRVNDFTDVNYRCEDTLEVRLVVIACW